MFKTKRKNSPFFAKIQLISFASRDTLGQLWERVTLLYYLLSHHRLLFVCFNVRIYQQVGDLGLFLFNDALVVATLTFKFVPFQRLVQRNYK